MTVETEHERHNRLYRQTHYASDLSKIPSSTHFAIIQQDSISYTDPYRDTNPDGTRTITNSVLKYIYFDSQEALEHWIEGESKNHYAKPYRVFRMTPVEVNIKTTVNIVE